jgi:CubicO group peptidase (beta-lactamase class C family)
MKRSYFFNSIRAFALIVFFLTTQFVQSQPGDANPPEECTAAELVSASRKGDLDEVKSLLDKGCAINSKTDFGMTALHAARITGRKELEAFLLEQGADPEIPFPESDALVKAIFGRAVSDSIPGAAVLVAQNGKIILEAGFGFADVEKGVPVSTETRFRIGSVTKQFTAAAILKLVEAGKLSLSDPLSKFIPDFPRGNEVTIHQLLTHTSGIESYTGKPDFMDRVTEPVELKTLVEEIKGYSYDFDPGTSWMYNNSGYMLLGYIIEQVSGQSYGEFLQEQLFSPLGMDNTGIYLNSKPPENEAMGYTYEEGEFEKAINWDMTWAGSAGALYSTVGDMFLWNEGFFGGKVLKAESMEAALSPVVVTDSSSLAMLGGAGYGYGIAMSKHRGLTEISHSGGLHGFVSYLSRYPEDEMTITILSNCSSSPSYLNPTQNSHSIAEYFLWEKMDPQETYKASEAKVENLEDYLGHYEYPGGAMMEVSMEDGHLFAQLTGQPKFEIYPGKEDVFFWKVVEAQITFRRDETGAVTHGLHKQGGQEFEVPKTALPEEVEVAPKLMRKYVGTYELEPGVEILITLSDEDELFAKLTGQPSFRLYPASETEFFLRVVNARVIFKVKKKKVSSLILRQGGREQAAIKRK